MNNEINSTPIMQLNYWHRISQGCLPPSVCRCCLHYVTMRYLGYRRLCLFNWHRQSAPLELLIPGIHWYRETKDLLEDIANH